MATAIRYLDLATGRPMAVTPPEAVLASSAALGWHPRAVAERQSLAPQSRPEHGVVGHRLFVNIGPPVPFAWGAAGRRRRALMPTGGIGALPDGAANAPAWGARLETVSFAFDPAWLAGQAAAGPGAPVRERRDLPDPELHALARALAGELAARFPDPLRGEALLLAAALRLVEAHGPGAARRPDGALSPARARRALEFIEDRLPGRPGPSVAALAAEAGLSEARFARSFRARFGLPPHAYVLRRRVARAREHLAAGRSPAEAAAACGFADQAHLTHAFRRTTGATPARWRRAAAS